MALIGSVSNTNITGTITGSQLGTGAAVTNLGYTPVNKAGDSLDGTAIVTHGLLSSTIVRIPYQSFAGTRAWKVCSTAVWYWGEGGTILEVWKDGYTSHSYGKFLITGHTRTGYGPGMNITTLISGATTPTLGSLTAVNGDYGYYNVFISNEQYWSYVIRITTPIGLQRSSNPPGSNQVYAYPDGSY